MNDENVVSNALGSATAGIISRVFTHPLDTAKARLQAPLPPLQVPGFAPYRGTLNVLTRTIQTEGFFTLYRGFGAILVGGTPGTMLYFCSYEFFKARLSSPAINDVTGVVPDSIVHFTSGMLAEALACIIYVPVDVIKERLQVQQQFEKLETESKRPYYRGSYDALKQILRYEGTRGIYKGYAATLASFGPFSALYFLFYEQLKCCAKKHHMTSSGMRTHTPKAVGTNDFPFLYLVGCSASAGAAASWLTSPLDMAKLRLQIQRGNSSLEVASKDKTVSLIYRGMADCLRQTYRQNGIRGLFRGAGARVIHFAPSTTITMTCYEECRSWYAHALSDNT